MQSHAGQTKKNNYTCFYYLKNKALNGKIMLKSAT